MVDLLLKKGADANHPYYNLGQKVYRYYAERHCLQDAIEMRDLKMIKLLCESSSKEDKAVEIVYRASVQKIELYTAIAFHLEAETFQYLLNQYKNSNLGLDELLLVAVYYNNQTALQLLLKAGANPNATCEITQSDANAHIIPLSLEGTALILAAEHARVDCVQILLNHGANPNAYQKEQGRFDKYGQGDSPLITAITNLSRESSEEDYEFGQIDNCQYKTFAKPTPQDYHALIDLLLKAGANSQWVSGRGETFQALLQEYLLKTGDPTLKPLIGIMEPPKARASSEYYHEAYALITKNNSHSNQTELLMAKAKQYGGKAKHWILPGGFANYQVDANLSDTLIKASGYQLGIDLSKSAKEIHVERIETKEEEAILELRQFHLPEGHSPILENTPDSVLFQKKRGSIYVPSQLQEIQFVALKDLECETIYYKGMAFPLVSYQDEPLPYPMCMSLAKIMERAVLNSKESQELALRLHHHAHNLLKQDVRAGDLDAVRSLMLLKIDKTIDISYTLELALEAGQYEIVKYLIEMGVRFKDFNDIRRPFEYHKLNHPEEIAVLLYDTHKHIPNLEWALESLCRFSGKNGYSILTDRLSLDNNTNALKTIGLSAFDNCNLHSIQMVFGKVPASLRDEWITHLLDRGLTYRNEKDKVSFFKCLEFLISQYQGKNSPSQHLFDEVAHIYEKLVEDNVAINIQKQCLALLDHLMDQKFYTIKSHAYGVYIRLKHVRRKQANIPERVLEAGEHFLAVLKKAPIFQITHASRSHLHEEFDSLLISFRDDPEVRMFLLGDYSLYHRAKDAEGNNCLQRAVKSNNLPLVKLLLESCFNHSDFAINVVDAQGKTPLQNATESGFVKISKLLKVNAAVYKKDQEEDVSEPLEIKRTEPITITNLPPTIASEHLSKTKTNSNIMCFGMICTGNGFAHVIKLAQLIKASDDALVNQKCIYVVGSVQSQKIRHGGTAYDKEFFTLLKAMYPEREQDFYNKSPDELVSLYNELKDWPSALAIKLFLNVGEANLAGLFEECEYSFNPAYRGATLDNTSISTSLAFGNIIYSHVGNITPQYLRQDGEYNQAMVLFDNNRWETYADNVLADIKRREHNKKEISEGSSWDRDKLTLNQISRKFIETLVRDALSPKEISRKHVEAYKSIPKPMPTKTLPLIGYEDHGLFKPVDVEAPSQPFKRKEHPTNQEELKGSKCSTM